MSDKIPAIKPKRLIRALERAGWQLDRVRGSHYIMAHPDRDQMVPASD
ncbi:MAG TPA: type II toxin-antitoxin system HicA family toxin [Solirubrobacteraceae bacterium]|jgi:predicted RNA binding protein YcfA (HicA-like mRNA interferase family)